VDVRQLADDDIDRRQEAAVVVLQAVIVAEVLPSTVLAISTTIRERLIA